MLGGATRGAGGKVLGNHVASLKGGQLVRMGASRGLVSESIRDQVAELTDLAAHSRAARPVYHVHADPPPGAPLDQVGWDRYWVRFEAEMGLQRQAFAEQVHVKQGREHRHRQYSLVQADGTTLPLAHDHARREKVGRVTEFEEGQPLTPGAHNRAVLAALDREGRADVATAMRAAGLGMVERPRAMLTPRERSQQERTGVDPHKVALAILAAWKASDNGPAFAAALRDQNLVLAQGDKVPVVVDAQGGSHPLARTLAKASKAEGARIPAASVTARLDGMELPRHDPTTGPRQATKEALAEAEGEDGTPPVSPSGTGRSSTPEGEPMASAAPIHGIGIGAPPDLGKPVTISVIDAVALRPSVTAVQEGLVPTGSAGPAPSAVPAAGSAIAPDLSSGDQVRPLDPTRPGDAARFLRETNAAWAKARAAASRAAHRHQPGGSNHVSVTGYPADSSLAPFRSPVDDPGTAPETVGGGGSAGNPPGHGRSAVGTRGGPQGPEHGNLRRDVGRRDGGRPAAAAGPAGATRRGEQDRPGAPVAGTDRRIPGPDRGAAGRHRIEERRAEIGLAARPDALDRLRQLANRLAEGDPVHVAAKARERLEAAFEASSNRTAGILSSEPWADPRALNVHAVSIDARDAVDERGHALRRAADQAEARRVVAAGRLGFLDRVAAMFGGGTARVMAAGTATFQAEEAARAAEEEERGRGWALQRAMDEASIVVRQRREERRTWGRRPDVMAAIREEHGNDLVRDAIDAGVPGVQPLAETDLAAARHLLLQQERRRERRARPYADVGTPSGADDDYIDPVQTTSPWRETV